MPTSDYQGISARTSNDKLPTHPCAVRRWEKVDPGDVEGVRRLASQPCFLGPKYRELTERVIDCDFGQGKDLRKPKLQEAVYESVVLELEAMIAVLDLGAV
jgi:hypothetical protein